MIKSPPKTKEITASECFNATTPLPQNSSEVSRRKAELPIISFLIVQIVKSLEARTSKKFAWDEKKQGLILGAFFWLHWVTQIPGGILAQKYGTKKVYGLSNFAGALFSFLIPVAAYLGYQCLIVVRVLQGLVTVKEFLF